MKIPGVRVKDPSASCYSTKIFDKRIFTTQIYVNKTVHFVNVLGESVYKNDGCMDGCLCIYLHRNRS